MVEEIKRRGMGIWYGKLDAVFLGWLIGVVIALVNVCSLDMVAD